MPRVQPKIHAFCHACGAAYRNPKDFPAPRNCRECGTTRWFNPTPISVLLQPVANSQGDLGILIAQRAMEPCSGQWALIGGFVEISDPSYEYAACREDCEEIERAPGVPLHNPGGATLLFSAQGDLGQMIAFSMAENVMQLEQLQDFTPNRETAAVDVAWSPRDLCFSSHTEALLRWFDMVESDESEKESGSIR